LRSPLRTIDLARTVQQQFPERSFTSVLSDSDPILRALGSSVRGVKRFLKPKPGKPPQASRPAWFEPWVGENDDMDASERTSLNSLTPINRDLYHQFHYGVNQSLLRKYDRISMANGIEVRMPFMDWRLVTYCFSLPDESKVGGGFSKRILREAMRGILPEKIRVRTAKIGFQAPLEEWMNGGLGDWALQRAQTESFLSSPVSNGPAISDFIAQRQSKKNWTGTDARLVWRHLQADLWRESFFGSTAVPQSDQAVA